MEKKTRYCHFCGDKTNDLVCTICGKKTSPISMRTKETDLDLITDDIADTKENFHGDLGAAESKRYQAKRAVSSRLRMVEGGHPYFANTESFNDNSSFSKAICVMAFVVIIIIFAFLIIGILTH